MILGRDMFHLQNFALTLCGCEVLSPLIARATPLVRRSPPYMFAFNMSDFRSESSQGTGSIYQRTCTPYEHEMVDSSII